MPKSSNLSRPKSIAICHEWLDNIGGGEKVLLEMIELSAASTVYTLWADSKIVELLPCKVETSFLQRLPGKYRRTVGLPLMPLAWMLLARSLSRHDLVISSSWAFAHFSGRREKMVISYVHTPGRYWWYPGIDQRTRMKLPQIFLNILRFIDKWGTTSSTVYVANSHTTQQRIKQCWNRESRVIHPPVDTDFYKSNLATNTAPFEKYLLGVGRFVSYKNHKFIIQLGEILQIPVVLVGHGELLEELKAYAQQAKIPVCILTEQSNDQLRNLYTYADCLVYPTIEDFGIVPVEAMSCGTRILGLNQGGLAETVISNQTGFLVEDLSLNSFADGYRHLPETRAESISNHASNFSKHSFHGKMRLLIEQTLSNVDSI